MVRDAQVSVVFGLAGCVVLLAAFACHQRAGRPVTEAAPPSMPQDPRRGNP